MAPPDYLYMVVYTLLCRKLATVLDASLVIQLLSTHITLLHVILSTSIVHDN